VLTVPAAFFSCPQAGPRPGPSSRTRCRRVPRQPSGYPAIARDRAPTLKAKFERELQQTESRLSHDVVRIVLCDGARALWTYIEEHPQYEDYEKLVDYHHTTETAHRGQEIRPGARRGGARCYNSHHHEPGQSSGSPYMGNIGLSRPRASSS